MKIGKWSTTAANNNTTPPDGWPEGQAPSTVNDCAREMMAAIRTAFSDLQYVDQDFTPTYISATTFSVAGDQTSAIHAGRRLKIYDATAGAATTIYATVVTASFTAVTTIQVTNDGGQLTSSLSSFAIAIIAANANSSLPSHFHIDTLSASGAAVLGSTLSLSGAATLNSTLTVSGATSLLTTLSVGGAAVVGGALSVGGATTLATTLSVSGAAVIKGALSVGGTAIVEGAAQFGTTLTASGAVALLSTLTVGGAAVIAGAAQLQSTLTVSGSLVAMNVARAWARFEQQGAHAIQQGYNIATITDGGVGLSVITYTTALPGAAGSGAYCVAVGCSNNTPVIVDVSDGGAAFTPGGMTVRVRLPGGTAEDLSQQGFFACFGR